MSFPVHLADLEQRHHDLERQIAEAQLHPSIDDLTVVELKRRKLLLKDQISRLRHDGERIH